MRMFTGVDNVAQRPHIVLPKERPGSSSLETLRAWSACDAAQNLGLPPLPESAVSLFIAVLVVIGPYNVLRPRSVSFFSIALGTFLPI
jgi:hypothetical protein